MLELLIGLTALSTGAIIGWSLRALAFPCDEALAREVDFLVDELIRIESAAEELTETAKQASITNDCTRV